MKVWVWIKISGSSKLKLNLTEKVDKSDFLWEVFWSKLCISWEINNFYTNLYILMYLYIVSIITLSVKYVAYLPMNIMKIYMWFIFFSWQFIEMSGVGWLSAVLNSSPSYMHQWIKSALVQIMACRLFSTKPFSKPMCWVIVNWTLRNKLQLNFNQNTKLFIHENASEDIICEMAAILSRGRWVNFSIMDIQEITEILCYIVKIMLSFSRPCHILVVMSSVKDAQTCQFYYIS